MIKHRKNLEDIENEKLKVEKEISSFEDQMAVIQNEHGALTARLENVKKENKIIDDNIQLNRKLEGNVDSYIRSL